MIISKNILTKKKENTIDGNLYFYLEVFEVIIYFTVFGSLNSSFNLTFIKNPISIIHK